MKARVFVYLVVSIGLMIATLDKGPGESAPPAPAASRQIYEVTIDGTVGNLAFSREGSLFLDSTPLAETPEGQNRINVWLVSGEPTNRGEQGAIKLATNGHFYSNGLTTDYAITTAKNFTVDAYFNEEIEANKNGFSFNGLTFETYSKIQIGQLHIDLLQGGKITGRVVLTGMNPATGQMIGYTADFNGHYLTSQ